MKKKIFSLLALAMTAMSASALDVPTYALSVGTNEHGSIAFTVNGQAVQTAAEGDEVTVTITADDDFIVNEPSGHWYAAVATSRQQRTPINLLGDITLAPVSGKENQWTFTMKRANAEVSTTYKKLLTHPDITITIAEATYNGKKQTPEVIVMDGDKQLVQDVDFTVSYKDNINASESTATVTIKGIGNYYAGKVTKIFPIDKAKAMVTFKYLYPYQLKKTYGDPNFTIRPYTEGDGTLKYYTENRKIATVDQTTGEVTIVSAGTVRIWARMSAGSNYKAAMDWYELVISPKTIKNSMVSDIADQTYTGEPLTPEVTVTDGETKLVEGTDYTLEYAGNVGPGLATATVTGIGNYGGVVVKTFAIPAMVELTLDEVTDNSAILAEADGKAYDVTLKRTLSSSGWNTFAAPFAIDAVMLANLSAKSGIKLQVKTLAGTTLADDVLTLNFADAESIDAGQPCMVKVSKGIDLSAYPFIGVTISAEPAPTVVDDVEFIPTFGRTTIEDNGAGLLFLGSKNNLSFPTSLPSDLKGFRAYFQLNGEATQARTYCLDFGDGEATGIKTIEQATQSSEDAVYDLSGRRMTRSTAKKGLYIVNGKKVVIK